MGREHLTHRDGISSRLKLSVCKRLEQLSRQSPETFIAQCVLKRECVQCVNLRECEENVRGCVSMCEQRKEQHWV